MPVYTAGGKLIAGVGGNTRVTVDGEVPASMQDLIAGSASPLNEGLVTQGRFGAGPWGIYAYDGATLTAEDQRGADRVEGGTTLWAAQGAGAETVFDSIGREFPGMGLRRVDEDDLLYLASTFQNPTTLLMVRLSGAVDRVPMIHGLLWHVSRRDGLTVFVDGPQAGEKFFRTLDGREWPDALVKFAHCVRNGDIWVTHNDGDDLIAYVLGKKAETLRVLSIDGHDFNPCITNLPNGQIEVASGFDVDEAVTRRYPFDPAVVAPVPSPSQNFPAASDMPRLTGLFVGGAWVGGGPGANTSAPNAGNGFIGAGSARGRLRISPQKDAASFHADQVCAVLQHYPDYTTEETALEQAKRRMPADLAAARAMGLGFYGYVDDVIDDEFAALAQSVNGPDCRWGETCALGDRYKDGETVDQFVKRFRSRQEFYQAHGLKTGFVLRADIRGIGRNQDGSLIGAVRADEQCHATKAVLDICAELGIDMLWWFGRGREGEIDQIWPLIDAALAGTTPYLLRPADGHEDPTMPVSNETAEQATDRLAALIFASSILLGYGSRHAWQRVWEVVDLFQKELQRLPTTWEVLRCYDVRRVDQPNGPDEAGWGGANEPPQRRWTEDEIRQWIRGRQAA